MFGRMFNQFQQMLRDLPLPRLQRAHERSINHRTEIEASAVCGCFYCKSTFSPREIDDWIDDEQTAICPHCGIDSVIGDKSGFPITRKFLTEMNRRFFGPL